VSDARAVLVLWGALSACGGGSTSAGASQAPIRRAAAPAAAAGGAGSAAVTTPGRSPVAGASAAGCGADIQTRRPGAEAVEGVDVDGDGDLDPVFRAGHSLHGNAEFLCYRVDGACAAYLGSIEAFIVNTPHCAAPPVGGAVCRLSASRRMFHDDYQETFFEVVGGALTEVGHGRYIEPRRVTKPPR
jgi:hypothetical protein